jgi:anti-sigma regulatory factor (Ser/Thr protein kinase)
MRNPQAHPAGQAPNDRSPGRAAHTDLPADVRAPRQARLTVRSVLHAWGLTTFSTDAELITSELVANAAEHGTGPIGLTISRHTEPNGQHGIRCEVSDSGTELPQLREAGPDSERGRGLHIVNALATTSGFTTSPRGKTAWFTLSTPTRERTCQADLDAQAGA